MWSSRTVDLSRGELIPLCDIAKQLLVPLTGSLYVSGKLADPENVLVDVGARYYIEKVRIGEDGPRGRSIH